MLLAKELVIVFVIVMNSSVNSEEGITAKKGCTNIYFANCESLRNKLDLLRYDTVECDIICLVETWLDSAIDDGNLRIPGYQEIIRKDRYPADLGTINHGGVAIYVRNEIVCRRLYELEDEKLESIWLEISQLSGKFIINVIYRPPSERMLYWDELERNLENARDKKDLPIYLCGDLNDNTLHTGSQIEPILQRQGLTILNNEPTFYTATSANCLDIFATSKPEDVDCIQTTSPTLSGHSSLILSKRAGIPKGLKYTRKVMDYTKTNWRAINETLGETHWEVIEDHTSLDDYAENFRKKFLEIIEEHTRTKIISVNSEDKRWMCKEIRKIMKKRNIAYKKAKENRENTQPGRNTEDFVKRRRLQ